MYSETVAWTYKCLISIAKRVALHVQNFKFESAKHPACTALHRRRHLQGTLGKEC